MKAKLHCSAGITNVWQEPAVRGAERIRKGHKTLHANQKPVRLMERIIMERIIEASSDPGDTVREPLGGLCPGAIAALNTGRKCRSAETNPEYYLAAAEKLKQRAQALRGRPGTTGTGTTP